MLIPLPLPFSLEYWLRTESHVLRAADTIASLAFCRRTCRDGRPFIDHTRSVAELVIDWYSEDVIALSHHMDPIVAVAAALLEDVVQDSWITLSDIETTLAPVNRDFPSAVRRTLRLVGILTEPKDAAGRPAPTDPYYVTLTTETLATIVKAADRCRRIEAMLREVRVATGATPGPEGAPLHRTAVLDAARALRTENDAFVAHLHHHLGVRAQIGLRLNLLALALQAADEDRILAAH